MLPPNSKYRPLFYRKTNTETSATWLAQQLFVYLYRAVYSSVTLHVILSKVDNLSR